MSKPKISQGLGSALGNLIADGQLEAMQWMQLELVKALGLETEGRILSEKAKFGVDLATGIVARFNCKGLFEPREPRP